MMKSEDAVLLDGVRVVRGGRQVLDGITARIPAGSLVGLLGPSGCGKTTLIRAIVGVQARVSGRVEVLGHPAGAAAVRREIAYVTQSASVYPDLTVAENLRYFARVVGLGRRDAGAEVARVLDVVGLSGRAADMVGRLSGGQRGRVSLAAALLGGPRVLVLDEPTVGLDPVLREDLWTTFAHLADTGVTLLVSSHVMDEARRCSHLLLLREGQLLATGAPQDLLRRTGAADMDAAFLALIRAAGQTPTPLAEGAAR